VKEGGAIYFKNCFFCHGALLDGRGHYARVFNPAPLPFSGGNTIAQLQESFLFWRIATGGPGLPHDSAPWSSSMPAWESMLSSDEVWKTILFLYDYTGNRPQAWQ
ncbi:MAG: c-type cytochrome, partial [Thermodesulfobacteriota bacterium]